MLTFGACEKSEYLTDGDYFYLSNDGANMPVWVMGNLSSDVILITMHGGPGDGGMGQHISKGFKKLEEDYTLVYWDQRFAGIAQGHPDKYSINVDQYIEDTEKLVQLIQQKYPGKKLFMIGHSWGGQLSAGYMGRDNHQDNFKGWIDLCGSIYGDLESQLMKEWIFERVPEQMAKPDADIEFWQFIYDWYEENPAPGNYTAEIPYQYVSALHGDAYFWETYWEDNPVPYNDLIFSSMFSMSYYVYSHGGDQTWVDDANFTPELHNITIPALLLWGAEDGIVPATVGDYVYEHLATDPADKELVKIPECAHGPQNDQPEIFYQEVSNFIESYK
jgi:pimeloyl-ACP methyl ester carboxylesterase